MGAGMQDPREASIVAAAEERWRLMRRGDLVALGLGAKAIACRVRTGRLHVLHPGVYALGHRALPRRAAYLAAVWWCGGDAALSGQSACAFYGWEQEDADHPPPVHVTTTQCKRSRPGVVVHQTRRLPADDVLTFERLLRVTDAARTLVDRADDLPYPALRRLADQLRELPPRLAEAHARLPGRAGWRRTELLIHSEDARARSELERRLTGYARRWGLPQPDGRNVVVAGCQADCIYVAPRVVLELDSRAHHQRRAEVLQDHARDRRYRRAGWTPIRVLWEELEPDDPALARELHELLDLAPCVRDRASPGTKKGPQCGPSRRVCPALPVGARGFEPPTSPTRTARATRLRHAPMHAPV